MIPWTGKGRAKGFEPFRPTPLRPRGQHLAHLFMDSFRIKNGFHHVICYHDETAVKIASFLSIEDGGKAVSIEIDEGSGEYRYWRGVAGWYKCAVSFSTTVD